MSYLAPPTPPGSLGWQGQTPQRVSQSGLIIAPGVGLVGRTQGGQLLLDRAQVDPPVTLSAFLPGALAANAALAVFRQGRLSGASLVSLLEANALTAPTTGDVNNYYGLKVTGSSLASSSLVLPVSAAGVAHYQSDHTVGAQIAGAPSSGLGQNLCTGVKLAYVPPAATTLTGFSLYCGLWDGANYTAGTIHGYLLDANGVEIPGTRSDVNSTRYGNYFRFPLAQPIAQGATVYCAVDCFDQNPLHGMQIDIHASNSTALPGLTYVLPPNVSFAAGNGQNKTAGNFSIFGQGNAVELDGDITLSCVVVGAPAATAAPSNINVRLDVLPA